MTEEKSSSFTTGGSFGPPLIGALLRAPWEEVRRRMLAALEASGFGDLDAAHLNVLLYPGPQGTKPSELAARMQVSKQALNYLLGELERMGYLERQPDPDDLRSKRIALTPRGDQVGWTIRAAVEEVERDWSAQLGAERFAALKQSLWELSGS